MKFENTKKLYYNQYVNKIEITIPCARFLYGTDFTYFESQFNNIDVRYLEGYKDLKDLELSQIKKLMRSLIEILKDHQGEYKKVLGWFNLCMYTNNLTFTNKIIRLFKNSPECISITRPKNKKIRDFLLENKNVIINNNPKHDFKISLKQRGSSTEQYNSFIEWADRVENVKLVNRDEWRNGYFYVTTDKAVTMCQLFIGEKIRRIERFVRESEIV